MSGMKPSDGEKKRPINPLTHPRAFDRHHGMELDERLFPNLTPKGWRHRAPPRKKDGS